MLVIIKDALRKLISECVEQADDFWVRHVRRTKNRNDSLTVITVIIRCRNKAVMGQKRIRKLDPNLTETSPSLFSSSIPRFADWSISEYKALICSGSSQCAKLKRFVLPLTYTCFLTALSRMLPNASMNPSGLCKYFVMRASIHATWQPPDSVTSRQPCH